MITWILHDTHFGNGKILAEELEKTCPAEWQVQVGDVKKISPDTIAEDNPDLIVVGGAIRMFQGAPKTKKWIKSLESEYESRNQKVPFTACFLTHALPTNRIQGWVKRYMNKFQKSFVLQQIYPKCITVRVKDAEGPLLEEDVIEAQQEMKKIISWVSSKK